jgi:pimeloyl-ACP methyl ester carboxylesterase/predicted ester cyclase
MWGGVTVAGDAEERVRRLVEDSVNANRPEALDVAVDRQVRVHPGTPGAAPDTEGIEELRAAFGRFHEAFPDLHIALDDVIAAGDRVAARWTATGTHRGELAGIPATGRPVRWGGTDVYRFADGKIVEWWRNDDFVWLLQQLGETRWHPPADAGLPADTVTARTTSAYTLSTVRRRDGCDQRQMSAVEQGRGRRSRSDGIAWAPDRAIPLPGRQAHARWAGVRITSSKARWSVMSSRSGTATTSAEQVPPGVPESRRMHVGGVVVGSLAAGFAAAVILPFLPVGTVDENFSTAMVLFGFALGWALLAVLSTRLTDQPQRWAVAPAIFMALAGVLVLVASDSWVDALGWVWPPALLVLVAWVWTRARREVHSRTRVWLLNPVLVILVLIALGGGYETISQSTGPAVVMRGQLVDVGPYRLHLECTGSRGPSVILEPGGGGSAATMGWIAPAVARDSRVCVYDRAGRGWSDPAASPPDGAQIATDLHALLERAHVPGPYVLAGHSFGGLYVRTYAAKYPEEVAGLVLVDSTAAHSTPVSPQKAGSYSILKHLSSLVATTSRLGVGRFIAQADFSDLPPKYRDDARKTAATGKHMSGFLDEFGVANRSEAEAGELRSLDAKPLVVLTADRGNAKGWMADQDKIATLSTNSLHRVAPGATHDSLVDNPDHAAAVTQAIHDVVVSVRTGAPLNRP